MMNYVIIQQIGTAVLLASLIGLERERKYQDDGHCGVGGLRTFLLIGLLGALTFILSNVSIWFFVALTVGFLAFIIASYVIASNKDTGASWIAAILVYLIGVFCGMQEYLLATVVALLVLAVLYFKSPLHALAKKLNKKEFISTMKFIIIAFVVLPLLPNVWIGPYEFFNIYVIWLMVVFISGISFLSYIAIKLFGTKRGIGITGFLAGLISSTALTLSFSGESRKNKNIINPYVVAVLVASSAMFFRILFEVVVLNASLLRLLIIPMLVMGIIGLFSAVVFWFKKGGKISEKAKNKAIKMESPFSLKPALKFAAFFAWILFLTKFASSFFGESGIYVTSIISGIMDVDAITVSMASLAGKDIPELVAATSIVLAAITNTIVKGFMFMMFGNKEVALRIILVFLLMLIAGIGSLFFAPYILSLV